MEGADERTSGKWETIDLPGDEIVAIIPIHTSEEMIAGQSLRNDGYDTAHCYGPDRFDNAELMAAAPELATALDAILRNGLSRETRKKARSALNKARKKQ